MLRGATSLKTSQPTSPKVPDTITDAARQIREGRTSSFVLTGAMLERSHRMQPTLEAFITINDAPALEAARRADAELARGLDRGPLHGIPIAIKDNIATADAPTTVSTKVLEQGWWTGRDATVVRRLREAGAVIIGKAGLDEFAFAPPDEDSGFPRPKNPWDPAHTPGGSSSGTAVAVAAGLVLGGLGTDTGGSIRLPAAHCGITGLQPSYGRVSNHGCVPGAFSLDVVGPMARSARDCALILQVIAGHDAGDPASVDAPLPELVSDEVQSLDGIRIGVPQVGFFSAPDLQVEVGRAVLDAVEVMAQAGASIVDIEIPLVTETSAAYWVIMLSEGYAYHEIDLRERPHLYGASARRTLLSGCLFTAADHIQAQRIRTLARSAYLDAMKDVNVIVTPASLYVAPQLESWGTVTRMFTRTSLYALSTLVGAPALSVPCGFSTDGLPIGLQIMARPFDEGRILKVGQAYQALTDWHQRRPVSGWSAA